MTSSLFFLFVASVFYFTGCLAVQDEGTVILQESIDHLINYTAYEALEYLNLKNLGSNAANVAYESYKAKLSECMHVYIACYLATLIWITISYVYSYADLRRRDCVNTPIN